MPVLYSYLLSIYILLLPILGRVSFDEYWRQVFLFIPSLLFAIFFIIKRPTKTYLQPTFIIIQLVLAFIFFLSCLYSTNPGFSIPQFFIWINCWLLIDLFLLSQVPVSIFTNSIIKLAIIYSVIFLLMKLQPLNINFFTNGDAFINPYLPNVQLSNYLIIAIPIVYFFTTLKHRKLILSLLSIALFFTNSRSSITSVIVGLEILNHFQPQPFFPRLRIYLIFFLVFYFSFFIYGTQYTPGKSPTGSREHYWYQALKGFQENPLFGIGPGNFLYASFKYQPINSDITAMSAHNIFLNYLTENGLIFSLVFFYFIITQLKLQFHQNPLFFTIAFVSLLNTTFSSSWGSVGIFIISLIFIFYDSHLITTKKNPWSLPLIIICLIPLLFHLVRLINSHQPITKENYYQAVSVYPYDLNTQLQIIKRFHDTSKFTPFFSSDFRIYQTITESVPLPQGEEYYYQLLSLGHRRFFPFFTNLIEYYLSTSNPRIEEIFSHFFKFIPAENNHQFSYFLNRYATLKKSTYYYQKSIEIAPNWAPLYIDYANFLWHNQQQDQALQVLADCQKLKAPQPECQQYQQSNQFDLYPPGAYPIPLPQTHDNQIYSIKK